MESHFYYPELTLPNRRQLIPFDLRRHKNFCGWLVRFVVGILIIGGLILIPLLLGAVVLRGFYPHVQLGREHHGILWLGIALGLSFAVAASATVMAWLGERDIAAYQGFILYKLNEVEGEFFVEIDEAISMWMNDDPSLIGAAL